MTYVEVEGKKFRIVLTTSLPHRFQCNNCGLCCESPVELTVNDLERLRKIAAERRLKLIVEEKRGADRTRYIMKPIPRGELEQECTFLYREGPRRLCSIYEYRPCFCRLYPIFAGVSKHTGEIYVDILHCPGVEHELTDALDENKISAIIQDIINFDHMFISILPNLDRAIVFTLYSKFRDVYISWPIKYLLTTYLNTHLAELLDTCENLAHVIYVISRFQEQVKESLKLCNSVFDISSNITKVKPPHISVNDSIKMLLESLVKAELAERNTIVLLDNYAKSVYTVRLDLPELRNFEITSDDIIFLKEMLTRFSCWFQTIVMPVEFMYSRGFLLLATLYVMYGNLCEDYTAAYYNFDAVALSVYTRYVINFLKELGLSYIALDFLSKPR